MANTIMIKFLLMVFVELMKMKIKASVFTLGFLTKYEFINKLEINEKITEWPFYL